MKKIFYLTLVIAVCFAFTGCKTNESYDVRATAAAVVICLIGTVFVLLAVFTNLLRDEISNLNEFNANANALQKKSLWKLADKSAPFSLTKVQFGLWTVIISSVYIYLSLFKGDCAETSINKTALVLMGIFAGTAVASSVMDKKEINSNTPRHQNTPSQGFFIDILSDDSGISLHRFQNLAWTIIAMTVYLYKVTEIKTGCDLPELSDTLLALTGISSATYLVMRSQENSPATTTSVEAASSNATTNEPAGSMSANTHANPAAVG